MRNILKGAANELIYKTIEYTSQILFGLKSSPCILDLVKNLTPTSATKRRSNMLARVREGFTLLLI